MPLVLSGRSPAFSWGIAPLHIDDADIAIEEVTELYDAVILATGAPRDRDLHIPGANSANVFGSAAFVGWYNGHPEYAALAPDLSGRHAVIIGMGNVALDVARILSKTEAEFEGSDIVAHALELLRDSNIETITILRTAGSAPSSPSPANTR